jgi:hypothetical protein
MHHHGSYILVKTFAPAKKKGGENWPSYLANRETATVGPSAPGSVKSWNQQRLDGHVVRGLHLLKRLSHTAIVSMMGLWINDERAAL